MNIYMHPTQEPQYIRQTLRAIKGDINSDTAIVGDEQPADATADHPDRNQAAVKVGKLKLHRAFSSDHSTVKIRLSITGNRL